jgi:hypothetical protein
MFVHSFQLFISIYAFLFPCKDLPSPPRSMIIPFFTHEDFYPSPLVSPMFPSYVKVQAVALVAIDSVDPSSRNSNIDLVILAYIDNLASYA